MGHVDHPKRMAGIAAGCFDRKNHVDFYAQRFLGVNLDNPSWAAVARAFGCEEVTVERLSDVGPALQINPVDGQASPIATAAPTSTRTGAIPRARVYTWRNSPLEYARSSQNPRGEVRRRRQREVGPG